MVATKSEKKVPKAADKVAAKPKKVVEKSEPASTEPKKVKAKRSKRPFSR